MNMNKLELAVAKGAAKGTSVCIKAAGAALNTKWGKGVMSGVMSCTVMSALAINVSAEGGGMQAQEVLDTITGLLGPGVIALGSLVAVVGGVQLGTSFTRNDPSSKTDGMMALIGGAIIAGVGGLIGNINLGG